ncbi:hypothetical protein CEXT_728121 [Caerostris extrusa]|uniref:Uncharacterized protein n=1 Tax=Caerostris extrusa TaxID=172846 RepID=A0AAV4RS17_CAEEX|nr:hypothetical protein CEXT_728121 [Caerostris extrusa]
MFTRAYFPSFQLLGRQDSGGDGAAGSAPPSMGRSYRANVLHLGLLLTFFTICAVARTVCINAQAGDEGLTSTSFGSYSYKSEAFFPHLNYKKHVKRKFANPKIYTREHKL